MGTILFQLPAQLPGEVRDELERSSVVGGQDQMPYNTTSFVEGDLLRVTRPNDESGQVQVPWEVPGVGRLMTRTATLMERSIPYSLPIELARGKINQLRCQTSDWIFGGLHMTEPLADAIHRATSAFGKALVDTTTSGPADEALKLGFEASETLIQTYAEQVFAIRKSRTSRLDTLLACRLQSPPTDPQEEAALLESFNAVCIQIPWRQIEAVEGQRDWKTFDAVLNWAQSKGLPVIAGPLIDFSGFGLPDWLWTKDTDLGSLCGYLSEHIQRTVDRYRAQIRQWQICAGANIAGVLALREDELLWLTVRLVEAARQIDAHFELSVGVSQPWGCYLAHQERTQSPFAFIDSLMRTGLKLSAIELEVLSSVHPRGTYCRDLLELSKLIDLYSYLGTPLTITLGYPSAAGEDSRADTDLRAGAGFWRGGFTPEAQADWARAFGQLALCKPLVKTVNWIHIHDGLSHQIPFSGLIDREGKIQPAMAELAKLRTEHLR